MNTNIWAKSGAVAYVLWGLLHLKAAQMAYAMAQLVDAGPVQGRLEQNAWGLLFFAIFGIVVAVWMNWNNSKLGYWLNLVVVSAADVGFVIFVLLPGHAPMMPGALGPILWIIALGMTTVGYLKASE